MTKKHSTKRALIASALSILLCVSMLAGTTFAWFTDTVSSARNQIVAGNLDIELEYSTDMSNWTPVDLNTNVFDDEALWEPGYTEVVYLRVSNLGNLALKYRLGINVSAETLGKTKDGEDIRLSDFIEYGIVEDVTAKYADRAAARDALSSATALNTPYDEEFSLVGKTENATDTDVFALVVYMPESVDNVANHDGENAPSIHLGLSVVATQNTVEEDGFDSTYDEEALYPDIVTDVIGGGETIASDDVAITLPPNAAEDEYTIKVSNKKTETNNANETTVSLDIDLLKNGQKVDSTDGVSYTVAIDIGAGLVITGLTHKDVAVNDYSYNPSTGIITFTTDSFSPFAVSYSENVIKVSTADELIAVLSEIKADAKTQIPGTEGNKQYRVNATIILEDDIVIDSADQFMYTDSNGAPLHIYGMRGVIDLNGHSITVSENALMSGKAHANAVLLVQYSNIQIIGEGSIVAANKSIPVYAWANCTVDIYSGSYVTNAPERNESAVYVNNATALVNVYGGTYTNTAYAFNVHDNCGSTTTIVLHEGIEYADFLKNGTIDVTKSDISAGRIAFADGCTLSEYEENGVAMNKVVK